MASKLLPLRILRRLPNLRPSSSSSLETRPHAPESSRFVGSFDGTQRPRNPVASRSFCSRPLNIDEASRGPTAIDYSSLLQESEFHRLAESTIHDIQEKLEEYGDNIQLDGFDIDYGNEVLTLKLGEMGTYVLNKQTPNRQIWLSSPIRLHIGKYPGNRDLEENLSNGPSRFDWDSDAKGWVYRRTKANLLQVLEKELEQLCGEPINLV